MAQTAAKTERVAQPHYPEGYGLAVTRDMALPLCAVAIIELVALMVLFA